MIAIESLTKKFGDFLALDGIDLTIGTGELFFLLGPVAAVKRRCCVISPGSTNPMKGEFFSTAKM